MSAAPTDGPKAHAPHPAAQVPQTLWLAAAERIISEPAGDRTQAARRFLAAAPTHGIDPSLLFGTFVGWPPESATGVREVCLAVLAAGRTAMLFVSEPQVARDSIAWAPGQSERAASVEAACSHLRDRYSGRVAVVQALVQPRDDWAVEVYRATGFTWVGDLAYMRYALTKRMAREVAPSLPVGIEVREFRRLGAGADEMLREALERSYERTLDCPELCGLRTTVDVIESHRASGAWNPDLWWLVFEEGRPAGCVLLNPFPDRRSVELVYIGLAPSLRGRRAGSELLRFAMSRLNGTRALEVTCAVDRRNAPAIRVYERMGFREFGGRTALVRKL